MRKKYKLFFILFVILFIIFLLLILSIRFGLIRFYPKEPIIESDVKWHSSVNDMYLESTYDEQLQVVLLSGTMILNDNIVDLEIGLKAGRMHIFSKQAIIIAADYNLDRDGNIILKNISYDENIDWQSKPKKIILQKTEKTGDG